MKRKRIIMGIVTLVLLVLIVGVAYLSLSGPSERKGNTDGSLASPEKLPASSGKPPASVEETAQAVDMEKLAEAATLSKVDINCKQKETPARIPKLKYTCIDLETDETQAKLETLLKDNPEQKEYSLHVDAPIGAEGFIPPTKEDPYRYLLSGEGSDGGFSLSKSAPDDIKSWPDLDEKMAKDKFQTVLQAFDIAAEPLDQIEIKREATYCYYDSDPVEELNYSAAIRMMYQGIPLSDRNYKLSDEEVVRAPLIELCYGEKGWLGIDLGSLMRLQESGEYTEKFIGIKKIASKIEAALKLSTDEGYQSFRIDSVELCYFPVDQENLIPVWKVGGYYIREQMGKMIDYFIDPETGRIYDDTK